MVGGWWWWWWWDVSYCKTSHHWSGCPVALFTSDSRRYIDLFLFLRIERIEMTLIRLTSGPIME